MFRDDENVSWMKGPILPILPLPGTCFHIQSSDLLQAMLGHGANPCLDVGILLEQRLKVLAVHFGQFGIDHRPHGGAPRPTEEQRQLTKEIAYPEVRPRGHIDFDFAFQHQEEGVSSRARLNDRCASDPLPHLDVLGHL